MNLKNISLTSTYPTVIIKVSDKRNGFVLKFIDFDKRRQTNAVSQKSNAET